MMRQSAAHDQSEFEALARRLSGVSDVGLRAGAARLTLQGISAQGLVALVADALHAVVSARADGHDVLAALGAALEAPEWDALRARAALEAHGRVPLAATYLVPRVEPAPDEPIPRVPDFGVGRPLTLGERKAVARGRQPDVIARVLRDPDPAVVAILLGNPVLVEAQVVRLAAQRPVRPAVLREVWRSSRWSPRHAVRLALVQNPWCPGEVAVRVVPLLTLKERQAVSRSGELTPGLRGFAAALTRP
ncbi:MAG: hypothetical protein R3B40_20455 [Polyangiales bacterium]|nr:hypothetical protein [Myxococcales bacterium]MCB9662224.1 hypothetical protein [Sandaracinaceae bacterium]